MKLEDIYAQILQIELDKEEIKDSLWMSNNTVKACTKGQFQKSQYASIAYKCKKHTFLPSLLTGSSFPCIFTYISHKAEKYTWKIYLQYMCYVINLKTELSVVSTSKSVTKKYPRRKPYLL